MGDWTTPPAEQETEAVVVVEAIDPIEVEAAESGDEDAAVDLDTFGRALVPEWVEWAEPEDLTRVLEAVCFSLNRPLTVAEAAAIIGRTPAVVSDVADLLAAELRERGLMLQRHKDEFQLVTRPATTWAVQRALNPERPGRLSKAALETLAIIAYRQPVTRGSIEAIRGVNSDAVVEGLERRGLIADIGEQDTPGRPRLFGTTLRFLQIVGLERIEDLPPLPAGAAGGEFTVPEWAIGAAGEDGVEDDLDGDSDDNAPEPA